jgi:transglutaminase-like putative cysteine protease
MTIAGRRLERPSEGWVTVLLVYLLALVLGWTVDGPAWVNGKGALTDGLPLVAVLGATVGLLGPKLGWGRWTTHGVGALFAGLLLPIFAGIASAPGASIPDAFHYAANGTVQAYLDLAWRDLLLTNQEVHYTLVLSWIVWGTMQFASYAVFGHHRPLGGVVMIGIVIAANMALVEQDLLYLLLYTIASLFLLIQMHAFDERSTWIRRRIGDPAQLSALYMRGGTVFIILAVAGSLMLTTRAASAPLAGAWDGAVDNLYELGETIARFLPTGANLRGGGGVSFGPAAIIKPKWFGDAEVAFTAVAPESTEQLKWRAATYDTFLLGSWVQTESAIVRVPKEAGVPLLDGTPEAPDPDRTTQIKLSVTPLDYKDSLLITPGTPIDTSRSSNVLSFGTDGWLAGVELTGPRQPYDVTAMIDKPVEDQAITQNLLRAANASYPADVTARYTDVPEGAIGNEARELLETIRQLAGSDDPYDLAAATETYLRDGNNFVYDPDLTDNPCSDPSAVECFARLKVGYCLHYASTMAILLREMHPDNPIPTRLVQGFLPGKVVGPQREVRNLDAHAWVEVYFPGIGWVPFDPTGGGIGIPSQFEEGPVVPPVPPASPTPRPSFGPVATDFGPDDLQDPGGGLFPGDANAGRNDVRPLFFSIGLLVVITIIGLAFLAWLRGPRGEVSPETAWKTISKTAARFGFAPRPTQTVYEYASSLGELIPAADADLQTVATARVETVYARTRLPGARLEAVRDATRRLRVSMLRLILRRPSRRRRLR